MKTSLLLLFLNLACYSSLYAQNILTTSSILALDAQWEEKNLHPDYEFFQSLLSDNFVWVHDHASMIDSKEAILKRIKTQQETGSNETKSRIQSDVKVMISGKTALVTGFTTVDRGPKPIKYHFMRTYAEVDGKCMLVGNHTMAIPEVD